jgi:hypothetical protein
LTDRARQPPLVRPAAGQFRRPDRIRGIGEIALEFSSCCPTSPLSLDLVGRVRGLYAGGSSRQRSKPLLLVAAPVRQALHGYPSLRRIRVRRLGRLGSHRSVPGEDGAPERAEGMDRNLHRGRSVRGHLGRGPDSADATAADTARTTSRIGHDRASRPASFRFPQSPGGRLVRSSGLGAPSPARRDALHALQAGVRMPGLMITAAVPPPRPR